MHNFAPCTTHHIILYTSCESLMWIWWCLAGRCSWELRLELLCAWLGRCFSDGVLGSYCTMLEEVQGCGSMEDLVKVGGSQHSTAQQACLHTWSSCLLQCIESPQYVTCCWAVGLLSS